MIHDLEAQFSLKAGTSNPATIGIEDTYLTLYMYIGKYFS